MISLSDFGIIVTLLLSLFNLSLSLKNQRKQHREYIFQRQFEFFMKLQGLIAEFGDSLHDMNQDYSELKVLQEKIFRMANIIDLEIDKNEIIIPELLYEKISDFSILCHNLSKLSFDSPDMINKEKKRDFSDKSVELIIDIQDFIGLEKLSEENRKLLRGKTIS